MTPEMARETGEQIKLSPIRQRCVLPSVYVIESDPHRGY